MTMTTIGGNTQPVTVEGRGVAVFLMIVGISLFGFITANIAAFLVAQGQDAPATTLAEIAAKLDSLELEFRALRRAVSGTSSIGSEEAHTSSNGEELDPKKIVSAGPLE